MYTKGLFLSNIVQKSVQICVSEHFSFAEIIYPPHRCGISRCWLDSMIIVQVCLRLAAIKDHSKTCTYTVLGGGVRKPVSIWCDHHLPHAVQHISFDCGLWNVGPLLFKGCVKLLDIGRNWTRCCIRRSRASQTCSMGDMSGEYAGHARTGMFSASRNCVQILATWGLCIIMLQHEVMVVDEWHNNGPQDLVTVSQ